MEKEHHEKTWANVDVTQAAAMANLDDEEDKKAKQRVKTAVRRLQRQGILDENGGRIRRDTPPDMREGSDTEFGG
jgi:hypothetical protein